MRVLLPFCMYAFVCESGSSGQGLLSVYPFLFLVRFFVCLFFLLCKLVKNKKYIYKKRGSLFNIF